MSHFTNNWIYRAKNFSSNFCLVDRNLTQIFDSTTACPSQPPRKHVPCPRVPKNQTKVKGFTRPTLFFSYYFKSLWRTYFERVMTWHRSLWRWNIHYLNKRCQRCQSCIMVKFQKHVSLDNHQTSSGYESEYVIRVLCFLKISKQKHSPKPSWQMILHNLRRKEWEDRRFQREMPSANNFIHTWWTPRQGRKFSSQFFKIFDLA